MTTAIIIVISAATLAATIAVPFISARRARPRKGLAYEIDVGNLTTVALRGPFEMTFRGEPVTRPAFVQVDVWNSGNEPIRVVDFEGPMTLTFDQGVQVLNVLTTTRHPRDLVPRVEADGHTVTVDPLLLNPGDRFAVVTVVDDPPGPPTLKARIAGVTVIERQEAPSGARRVLLSNGTVLLMLGFATVGYVSAGVALVQIYERSKHVQVERVFGSTLCATSIKREGASVVLTETSGARVLLPAVSIRSINPGKC